MSSVSGAESELRLRRLNSVGLRSGGDYVLCWMIASRRSRWNYGLERAVAWSRELARPLLVFEPLRFGYDWASDRHHRVVLDGMADNAAIFGKVRYMSSENSMRKLRMREYLNRYTSEGEAA
jgi:deoxyribodipyrimidine photo-lyase